MSDIIVQIPGATNVTVDDAPASAIVVTFPASTETVVTVIDRGILYGVQGPQGESGGVNTVNGQSGNVTLDTSEIPENPSYLYYTQARFDSAFAAKSTTNLAEGTNEYFTAARVRAVVLTGLSLATNAVISATDTVLSAFGKLQAQITANLSTLTSHISDTSNPHSVTKSQVGLGNADNTSDVNKPVSTATQTALNAKQDTLVSNTNIKTVNSTTLLGSGDIAVQPTLVSGTNIKTLNSVSLLGSGDIVLAATPSGVSGAIQFSNGSAFASDATNFFWDNTNKRLGIGTNAPTAKIDITGGSTSGTSSVKIKKTDGTNLFQIRDDGLILIGNGVAFINTVNGYSDLPAVNAYTHIYTGVGSKKASARMECESTTQGFLPPRMTTTQKNAITSPAAGLIVYDTTLAKLCVYTTTWETITSL